MPHLIEEYSRATGLRIGKPVVHYDFFPLPSDYEKFIVVVNSSGLDVKNYSYFDEVLWMLKPSLEKDRIKTIQCGNKDDPKLEVDMDLRGHTSLTQFIYLIKQSYLVLSGDTSAMHIGNIFGVPLVSIFGATQPEISGPYFGEKHYQRLIQPQFEDGESPSFGSGDGAKKIDTILPETVALAVGELLEIEPEPIETVAVGSQYKFQALEVIPDHLVAPQNFAASIINLRLDYGGTDELVYNSLYHRKGNIVTKTPLDINILTQLLPNIQMLIYEIDENHDVEFVKKLHHAGIPYNLMSYWTNEELNKIKLQYADFHLIHQKNRGQKSDLVNADLVTEDTEFRTNKFLLSKGKVFLSKAHWEADISVPTFDSSSKILDVPDFWNDLNFFYLFNRKSLPNKPN